MKMLIILPVIIPLGTAILLLFLLRWKTAQRTFAVISAIGQMIVALLLLKVVWENGIQAVQVGNWQAPFGISFAVDLLAAIMVVLAALMGLAVVIYSLV
ncbi:MAG TPA: Na+/H+ antiporter subunit D, partial [bacterium]